MKAKKIAMIVLALITMFSSCVFVSGAKTERYSYGSMGNISWCIDHSTSTLTISGKDPYPENLSWEKAGIYHIIIEEGITSIPTFAFRDLLRLQTVKLPKSIKSIGNGAFSKCKNLTSITIQEGLETIAAGAFGGCDSLKSISLPKSLKEITEDTGSKRLGGAIENLTVAKNNPVFYSENNCLVERSTKTILTGGKTNSVPKGATRIYNSAFSGLKGITSIDLSGIEYIGERAFELCSDLAEITFSDDLFHIGGRAFNGTAWVNSQPDGPVYAKNILYCYNGDCPESVTVAQGVTEISGYAFDSKYTLKSISIPQSVTRIGERAFISCDSLESASLSSGMEEIESGTFMYCSSLKEVYIPEGIKRINEEAFYQCASLESIVLPKSVEFIGRVAFLGCQSLKNIVFPENLKVIRRDAIPIIAKMFGENAGKDAPLYIKNVLYKYYGTNIESLEIKDGTVSISDAAFNYCGSSSITIPLSVEYIGSAPFSLSNIKDAYYRGTKKQWDRISIANDAFNDVTVHYRSCIGKAEHDADENNVCRTCGLDLNAIIKGDLDDDGDVTADDAIYLLYHVFFASTYPVSQPVDFNNDGSVTADDAIYLLYHVFFADAYPI